MKVLSASLILSAALIMVSAAAPSSAAGRDVKPAIVYDLGTKFDHSFNESVYDGAKRWSAQTHIPVTEFELSNESQREQAIRHMAEAGANPVITVGFAQAAALTVVADEFPKTDFIEVDAVVAKPNVQSITVNYQDGAFIIGIIAALASKTGTVGFVGGMDIPLIRDYSCGYRQGAHSARASIKVLDNYAGTTPAAWNDPTAGGELAHSQFDRGADVVFEAAGATGVGVLRAASEAHRLAIGTGLNMNALYPGSVLTSSIEHFDTITYNALSSEQHGTWHAGHVVSGLADGALTWELDKNNAALITPQIRSRAGAAKRDVIAGKIKVAKYSSANSCPL